MVESLKFKIYYSQVMSEVQCFDWPCILGRSMDCQVRIKDPGVSRKHLEVKIENNKLFIRNLMSSNIALINDTAMIPGQFIEISENDEIKFSQAKNIFFKVERVEAEKINKDDFILNNNYAFEENTILSEDKTLTSLNVADLLKSEPDLPPMPKAMPSLQQEGNAAIKLGSLENSNEPLLNQAISRQSDEEFLRLQEEKRRMIEQENEQLRAQIIKKVHLEAQEDAFKMKQQASLKIKDFKERTTKELEALRNKVLQEVKEQKQRASAEANENLMKINYEIERRKEKFNQDVTKQMNRIQTEKKNWEEEKKVLQKQVFEKENRSRSLSEQIVLLDKKVAQVIHDLDLSEQHLHSQREKGEQLRLKYVELQEKIDSDLKEHRQTESQWTDRIHEIITSYEDEKRSQLNEMAELKSEAKELERSLTQVEEIKAELKDFQERRDNVKNEWEEVSKNKNLKDEEFESLNNKINRFNDELTHLTDKKISLETEIQELKFERDKINDERKGLVSKKEEELNNWNEETEKRKKELAEIIEIEKKEHLFKLEEQRSEALQETYEHKARVKREVKDLQDKSTLELQQIRERNNVHCKELIKKTEIEQRRMIETTKMKISQMYKEKEVELDTFKNNVLKLKKDIAQKETVEKQRLERKEAAIEKDFLKREEQWELELEKRSNAAAEEAKGLLESQMKEVETLKNELITVKEKETSLLKSQYDEKIKKIKIEFTEKERKARSEVDKKKIEMDALSDRLVAESNAFKIKFQKDFESRIPEFSADITDSTFHLMGNVLKSKLGVKFNSSDLRQYKKQITEVISSTISLERKEKSSEVNLLLQNARVPQSVKKYWVKVSVALVVLMTISSMFYFNEGLGPKLKETISSVFIANNSASDIFIKKIEEARRKNAEFNPKKDKKFKYGYLKNILYTEGYLERVSSKEYYQQWVERLNKFFVDELELSDEAVVQVVTTESNLYLKLVNALSKIRLNNLDKGLDKAKEIEQIHIEKIQQILKSPRHFQRFMKFREAFYLSYKS